MGIHRNTRFTTRLLTIAAGRRYISNQQTSSRHQLLLEIYHAAFQNLEKDSPEYNTLSRSGKVWENFFKPQDVHPYLLAQTKLQSTLDRVDKQKLFYTTHPKTFNAITRALVHEYAHQSTGLEGSNLQKVDSLIIEDELEKQFLTQLLISHVSRPKILPVWRSLSHHHFSQKNPLSRWPSFEIISWSLVILQK